ncbi:YneF family protein [Bacillus thuringiensis]|uniref:YneF family protein n=1 Tax=Bacillus thuringiensis TaxID=1428 RepID=UPI0021D66B44|nr:YneF family protein [Bacillus thuringiensis]MCU7666773.1 YneF family protein [Bacillus thuringiensis]
MTMMTAIIIGVASFIIGVAGGFFAGKSAIAKYLEKNPALNEEMIKMMMMQMGQKPSQKKVNQILKAMNKKAS